MSDENVLQPPVDGGEGTELPTGTPNDDPKGENQPSESVSEPKPEAPDDPVNKRFSKLTREAEEAKREAAEARREAMEAYKRMAEVKPPADPKPAEDVEPVEPEFQDPEQYQRDMAKFTREMAAYTARKAVASALAEHDKSQKQAQAQRQREAIENSWAGRRQKAIAEIPDYLDVAENTSLPVSQAMAAVIKMDARGPEILYHLGKHPDEAARIASLPPLSQVAELGAFRERILTPTKPTASKAPAPIKPLSGARGAAPQSMDEMPMEEYAAHRLKH